MPSTNPNIIPHVPLISREDREARQGHRAAVLWFTGYSGAGKSTLAHALDAAIHAEGIHSYVLDGDNVRHGLCSDLGFSLEHRSENIRRIGETAKLFMDAGLIVLTAFISPLRADRDRVRSLFRPGDFLEIYCEASLEVCEERDVKGLYDRARKGLIKDFTGISSPYEPPLHPDLVIKTGERDLGACVKETLDFLVMRQILGPVNDPKTR